MTNFKDHFSERAAGYAAYRPHYPPALADYLATLPARTTTAWDAGCGNGQISTLLGDRFERVIATDASAAQIERAKPHPRVAYAVAAAEQTGIPAGSIDLITVAQAVHWFDLPRFYLEARRVSRPGSVIAILGYGPTEVEGPAGEVVDDFYSRVLGKWWPPERSHIETGYRHLDFPFAELRPPEFDMGADWSIDQLLGYISTWSAVRAMESADGPDAMERFSEAIRETWGAPPTRRVRWPLPMRVGRM